MSNSVTGAKLLLIVAYAGISAAGLAFMKSGSKPLSAGFILGFALYGAAFGIWILVILPSLPLSVAFPISAGAIVLGTLLVGRFALGESLTLLKIIGATLIVIGISIMYYTPVGAGDRS